MHARLDELLSLRDGAPVDARVRAHVDACPQCATALAHSTRLQAELRELPPVPDAARDGWAGVQSRLAAARRRERRVARLAPLAAAASVAALGVFAALRWLAPGHVAEPPPGSVVAASEVASIDELRVRSQALEALLAAMPDRPRVERADTSVPIDSLEAQVQWLDHQLSLAGTEGLPPDAQQRLWRDRVEVMNSLVQLRYVEAQHVVL
jgi:hypothetical protein